MNYWFNNQTDTFKYPQLYSFRGILIEHSLTVINLLKNFVNLDNRGLIQRIGLSAQLEAHTGCVN